ncbi:T9SS type A sorting domain-containing protein [Flammeovirga pacifica]|uniref:Secretion system C-terminal sorting domain-containing protein n=1 Tax=Flammeovirga pacifica TaxID=915059 RepID=A0A1S1Z3S6_FLAPC|nr:T9SS type A sorting domain-containing protein [Flammeovirga pacifica]OHX67882.1 hypothetical protein NH26_16825 [Flammeovirga pacifica]
MTLKTSYWVSIVLLLFTISHTLYSQTPPSTNLIHHFDAADVVIDGSGNVSSWADKSNSVTFISEAGTRPTQINNGLVGNPTIKFADLQYLKYTGDITNVKSIYVIFKSDEESSGSSRNSTNAIIGGHNRHVALGMKYNGGGEYNRFSFDALSNISGKYSLDFGSPLTNYAENTYKSADNYKWEKGKWHVVEVEFNTNDGLKGSESDIYIGTHTTNSDITDTFHGEVAEIIIYSSGLEDVDPVSSNTYREELEEYIDDKYRLYTSEVWYTTTGGGTKTFTDPLSWTTSSNGVGGTNGVPQQNDEVHILGGETVTAENDNLFFKKLVVEENGILELKDTKGHTFSTLEGTGEITLKTNNIPLGDGKSSANGFYNYNEGINKVGTIRFLGVNDIILDNSRSYELGNVSVNLVGKTLYFQDLDIDGNLDIVTGNVAFGDFSGGTFVGGSHTLSVHHDVIVSTNGKFDTNINDTNDHIFNIYGDALFEGEVNAPKVSLRAIDENNEQTFTFNNSNEFDQIYVNKGVNTRLNITASNPNNLTVDDDGAGFTIIKGILNTGVGIHHDFQNVGNGSFQYTLSEDCTLEVGTGSILKMSTGNVFYLAGNLKVEGGIFDMYTGSGASALPTHGITMRETGQLEMNSGTLKTSVIRPTIGSFSAIHRGSIKLFGGTTYIYGTYQNFYSLVLPFPDNTFEMYDGAELNISAPDNKGIHIVTKPENVNVSGGEINILTTSGNDFIVNSSAPFYNVNTIGEGTVILGDATYTWNGNSIVTPATDLHIEGSLSLGASKLDGNNKDIYIKKNLTITQQEPFVYTGSIRNTSDNAANWFQSSVGWINIIGNEDSEIYFDYPLDEDISAETGNISFGNIRINKDNLANKVTLNGGSQFSVAIKSEAEYYGIPTDAMGPIPYDKDGNPQPDGSENYSNLLDFEGDFELLRGTFDHRNYSVRMFKPGASIVNHGIFGVYTGSGDESETEGTTGVNALLKFREGDVDIETINSSVFGNTRLYLEDHKLSFSSDVALNRVEYISGTVNLSSYLLTIDRFRYGTTISVVCSGEPGCIEESMPRFGKGDLTRGANSWQTKVYNNFFVTDGKASGGGLKLKVDDGTRTVYQPYHIYDKEKNLAYTANHGTDQIYQANSRAFWGQALTFPMAVEYNGDYVYTPATVLITNKTTTNDGYITVSPALSKLPTANQTVSDELLNIYWNVDRSDFIEDVNLPTVRWFFEIPNNFGAGNNPFTSDNNDMDETLLATLAPGKVLDGDNFIRENNALVNSTYERTSFDSPVFDGSGNITNFSTSDIKRDILAISRNNRNFAYDPVEEYYKDKLLFSFEEDYDGSNDFTLENANYTVGHPDRFTGAPRILVYHNKLTADGKSYDYGVGEGSNTWDNYLNWYVLDEAKYNDADALTPIANASELPTANDVAILGTEDFTTTGIILDRQKSFVTSLENGDNVDLAELRFEHSNNRRGTLKIYGGHLNIGKVTGAGELAIDFGVSEPDPYFEPQLNGDFGEWADNNSSIMKLMFPYKLKGGVGEESLGVIPHQDEHALTSLTKVPNYNLTEYPTVEIYGGSGYFDYDFNAYAIDIFFRGVLYVNANEENGNITVEETLTVKNNGTLLFSKDGAFPKTVNVKNLATQQITSGGGPEAEDKNYIYIEQGNAVGTPINHTINVSQNIALEDTKMIDLFGGGTNGGGALEADVSKVTINLIGEDNGVFSHTDVQNIETPEFYDITMNKGKNASFEVQNTFDLAKEPNGTSEEKSLVLNSGTFILAPATPTRTISIDLNSGGEIYYLASDAALVVKENATVSISSLDLDDDGDDLFAGGMLLDGKLEADGGNIYFNQGTYNFISYGVSGNAFITVKSGEFIVGGQVRRSLNNSVGTLTYYQSGGKAQIGGQDIPTLAKTRGIFEITDEGSINLDFQYVEGDLTNSFTLLGSATMNGSNASLIFTPSSSLSSNFYKDGDMSMPSRILIQGNGANEFAINSTISLGDIELSQGFATLIDNDLNFVGNFYLASSTVFDQDIKDVYSKGDIYNSGTFNSENATTYFLAEKSQYLRDKPQDGSSLGIYKFGNVNISAAGTRLIPQYGKTPANDNGIGILKDLTINDASRLGPNLLEGQTDIMTDTYVYGNLLLNAGTISHDVSQNGHLIMAGTDNQLIKSDNGVVYTLVIDNDKNVTLKDPENEDAFQTLVIEGNLQLKEGNLMIAENTLKLNENSSVTGANDLAAITDFGITNMIVVTDRNRNGGVQKFIKEKGTDNIWIPLGVGAKFTPLQLQLGNNGGADTYFGVKLNILNEIPVKAIVEGKDQSNAKILDFAWYASIIDNNGDLLNMPANMEITFHTYYDESDVINGADEAQYIASVNLDDTFTDLTITEVNETDNYGIFKIDEPTWSPKEGGIFEALFVIGHEEDIIDRVPRYRTKGQVLKGNVIPELTWNDETSWEVYDYDNSIWANAGVGIYPSLGDIVEVIRGTSVVLDDPAELAEITIEGQDANYDNGRLILTDGANGGSVGKVDGSGRLVMRLERLLDDNWVDFFTLSKGGVIMDIPGDNSYEEDVEKLDGSGEYEVSFYNINAINNTVSGIEELTLEAPTNGFAGQTYPVYTINNNITIGLDGLTIKENAGLIIGDKNQVTVTVNTDLTLEGTAGGNKAARLYLNGGSKIIVNGDFIAKQGAIIKSFNSVSGEKEFVLKHDIKFEDGVTLSSNDLTFLLEGTTRQIVEVGNDKDSALKRLVLNNNTTEATQEAIQLEKNLFVGTGMTLLDGRISSNSKLNPGVKGFLYFNGTIDYAPSDVVNQSYDSYITGRAQFRILATHEGASFFPIGKLTEFHPIGIGQIEEKETFTHKKIAAGQTHIVWQVEYLDGMKTLNDDDVTDINLPTDIKGVYNSGHWELNPLTVGETPARQTEEFSTHVNFIYDGKLEGFATESSIRLLHHENGEDTWNYLQSDAPDYLVTGGVIQSSPIVFYGSPPPPSGTRMSNMRTMSEILGNPGNSDNLITVASLDPDLPVELISFTASIQNDEVLLDWATATEINNDGFYIERSLDNKNWEEIDFVEGRGNTNYRVKYSYIDKKPLTGKSYYRLIQTDFDGKFEIFGPVSILNTENTTLEDNNDFIVYPNPNNTDDVSIAFSQYDNPVEVVILNSNGVQLSYLVVDPNTQNEISVSIRDFSTGMYFIKVIDGSQIKVKKLIVR